MISSFVIGLLFPHDVEDHRPHRKDGDEPEDAHDRELEE